MNRYVVLSVNENPQYIFYLPLVVWAWKKFGWNPIVFCSGQKTQTRVFETVVNLCLHSHEIWKVGPIEKYNSDTIAQVSRLYAACLYGHKEDYLMTSDVDMLPLSDYWQFNPEKITTWGHDLTNFQHYPICFIGMKRTRWVEVMGLSSHNFNDMMKRDLDRMPNAQSADSAKLWVTDQDLITEKINNVTFDKVHVPRGSGANGYPIGRVDRSAWTLEHAQFIDAHMLRDIYLNPDHLAKTLLLLYKVWPNENFKWFTEYTNEYSKLIAK